MVLNCGIRGLGGTLRGKSSPKLTLTDAETEKLKPREDRLPTITLFRTEGSGIHTPRCRGIIHTLPSFPGDFQEQTTRELATRQHSQAASPPGQGTPMLPQLTSCEWSGRAAGPLGRHQRWLHRPGSASPPSLSVLCWQARVGERKETQKSIDLHSSQQSGPKLSKGGRKRLVWVDSVSQRSKWNKYTQYTWIVTAIPGKHSFLPIFTERLPCARHSLS